MVAGVLQHHTNKHMYSQLLKGVGMGGQTNLSKTFALSPRCGSAVVRVSWWLTCELDSACELLSSQLNTRQPS